MPLVLGKSKTQKRDGAAKAAPSRLETGTLFQEFFKPIGDLVQAADAVVGLAAAAQLVVLAVEHAQAAFHPVELECGEHLEPFHQPAAVVLI